KHTRWITFAAGMVLAVVGGYWLSERLSGYSAYIQYFGPLIVLLAIGYALFRLVNKPRMADFLVATEGEMKKVSWSNRKEIIGSTKVVIFTTFAMAIMLFIVDFLFQRFFVGIGVIIQQPAR
ncbi:MAG: preprotein translocase subunit SecE, partial [Planctomycetes bacterium]|nr:preprotein translocase subunit SecE [Planctomycetota bacterium]